MRKLANLHMYRDARGDFRCYLRRKGHPSVPLYGTIGSPEFMRAYRAALKDSPRPLHKATVADMPIGDHVYFVRSGGFIKIGRASDVSSRIASLQTGSPEPLEFVLAIPGSAKVEKALHRKFRKMRAQGEWFRAEAALLEFIASESTKKEQVAG